MIQEVIEINKFLERKDLNLWDFVKESEVLINFNNKNGEIKKMTDEKVRKSRRERFLRYREQRLAGAVHAIQLCENMSNPNSYEYSENEAKVIIKALREAVTRADNSFSKKQKKGKYFSNDN
jgi:hypothetical protein|tara:strand:+ start:1547 stop:1912 length:366 start_codon:yes stop_codon:yes gene_type:complete